MSDYASWGRDVDPDFQEEVLDEIAELIGEVRKRRGSKLLSYTLWLNGVQVVIDVRRLSPSK